MQNKFTRILSRLVVATSIFTVVPSFAAKTAPTDYLKMDAPIPFVGAYTKAAFNAQIKKVKEDAKRTTASEDIIDENAALSKEFMNIRNALIGGAIYDQSGKSKTVAGAKTSEDIQNILSTLDENFHKGVYTAPDAKLLAAQLLVLRAMRGFVFRARNIFETPDGNARFAHSWAVTLLRASAAGIDVYLPTSQWQAGFKYITEPFYVPNRNQNICVQPNRPHMPPSWTETCDISNGSRYQAWLRIELLPRLNDLNKVLTELDLSQTPIYWDNKILYGSADFVSSKDRFLRLGEAERLLMLSGTQAMLSSLYGINAYHLTGLFESMDSIAKVYGFSQIFQAEFATAENRFNAVRKHKNLFRFKSEERTTALAYLAKSYELLKTSMQNSYLAWVFLDNHQDDKNAQDNLIDPRLVVPFQRILNTGFNNAFGVVGINKNATEVANGEVFSALFNNEKVTVKLKNFFTNPPNSLQDFMPTGYVSGNEHTRKVINGTSVEYRNYYRGNPAAWDYKLYGRYFGDIKNSSDVKRTARVLSQSWGGFLLGLPMGLVMM